MRMTIKEAYLQGRAHLTAASVAEPAVEAEMLLRHVLRMDRARLYTHWDGPLAPEAWNHYQRLLEERGRGRPVHYIVGEREFMGLAFAVDERVMIPRPETEVLVEETIRFLAKESHQDQEFRSLFPVPRSRHFVVDVGTGSGCIAISIAYYVPDATVYATDISAAALELARHNMRRHGVDDRVQFVEGDLLSPLPRALAGHVDAVVSNPPYVPASAAGALPREIRDFEPQVALFAPGDGTAAHRLLIDAAPEWLRPGGRLTMEVGLGQAESVRAVLRADGRYANTRILRDGGGIDRVVAGTFQPDAK